MAQASKMNRGYSGGLAAGAPAGGSFRSSFQSSYTPPPMQPAQQQPQRPSMQPTPDLMPAPLPFGGFRQQGGPVMPGQAYIVGEAGPELIVPQMPGMVLPNQTLKLSPGAQAYLERQKAPSPERSSVGQGALNMGLQLFAAPGAAPGELVGEYNDPNNGSRITSNPANRRYSEMDPTNLNGPETFNSLANRPVRQVGRSANDINRIAEQQRRRGDPRAIMQLGMMEKNQQFVDAQNDKNFQQGMQMFGMNQQAQAARDQQSELQRQSMEEARRQWELQMYGLKTGEQAMRDERERAQQEAERQAAAAAGLETITDPSGRFTLPGIRTKGGEFRPMGGAYPTPQEAGVQMTPVEDTAPAPVPKFQQDKDTGKMFYIEPNGQGGFRRKWVDEDGDGTVSRAEQAKAGAAGGRPVSPFVAAFGNQ